MGFSGGNSEIVESNEELNSVQHSNKPKKLSIKVKADKSHAYTLEDDLDRLIKAINLRASSRVLGPSGQTASNLIKKNALKKPVIVGPSQSLGIGISEPVTLKQALRRLCISQASEMAAMKRVTKSSGASSFSEYGLIKKMYASVDEEKRNMVEISIMPDKKFTDASIISNKCCKTNMGSYDQMSASSPHAAISDISVVPKMRILDVIKPTYTEVEDGSSASPVKNKGSLGTSISRTYMATASRKMTSTPRPVEPTSQDKTSVKKNRKTELASSSGGFSQQAEVNKHSSHSNSTPSRQLKEPAPKILNPGITLATKKICSDTSKLASSPSSCSVGKAAGGKVNECSRSREKGECSHSSKSSIGDYSSGTSISDESHQSGISCNGSRPHMSKDIRWVAIHDVLIQQGSLGLKDFNLLKKLGCGDIGTVYVAELIGTECLFALKVMDIDFLISRRKMIRAQTEREILQMLDHPFLPTLYSRFTTDNLSCLVMEYCPGGDLHVLRQKQPSRYFSEPAARFYVAEVLLALEYLHMLGVIYRDLKPENILVREDGHIMLSDFDLSLRCSVNPTLLRSSSPAAEESSKKLIGPCAENSCIDPICLQPSCFTPRLISSTVSKTRKIKADMSKQVSPLPQLVVEPTDARSNSFVGTHEYLAPEIIRGDGHGSAVDWWTFGIFLYELLFGRTPFKGPGNEETLTNVICQSLQFPENPDVSFHARDLIRGLLIKEPENRLGSVKGAAEIKQHPFFDGLNWALIRSAAPPETLGSFYFQTPLITRKKKEGKCLDFRSTGENVEFELF